MREPAGQWVALLSEAGCSTGVIKHCIAVRNAVMDYWPGTIRDTKILEAGALLHDIGRGITHGIVHAQAGAEYCRMKGVPEPVARVVERHIGAGLTADECTLLRLMPIDCMPRTLEEKMVANADNLVAGIHSINIDERMMRSVNLSRHLKRRLFHLWLEMEVCRRSLKE